MLILLTLYPFFLNAFFLFFFFKISCPRCSSRHSYKHPLFHLYVFYIFLYIAPPLLIIPILKQLTLIVQIHLLITILYFPDSSSIYHGFHIYTSLTCHDFHSCLRTIYSAFYIIYFFIAFPFITPVLAAAPDSLQPL